MQLILQDSLMPMSLTGCNQNLTPSIKIYLSWRRNTEIWNKKTQYCSTYFADKLYFTPIFFFHV